jgi:cytochrome c-type biogenesis protein CcmF
LTAAVGVLALALFNKDFHFHYVAQYSSRLLPWYYSLSALWVGQAGSLLLWAWMLALVAHVFSIRSRRNASPLRYPAFGVLMAYICFLVTTMVFAADPMEAQLASAAEGEGLSPLLQHPAMLIHPPIVFLGYAAWAVPFALAIGALLPSPRIDVPQRVGQRNATNAQLPAALAAPSSPTTQLTVAWVRECRPWALFAWAILGTGILLGAEWSYEELGWGGYWGWDPVENGSLIPWLTGTACLHGLMVWQFRGIMKKATMTLAMATFALCNFATFLTRSGIFSSLHAFSQSPIGWLFLGLMGTIAVGGTVLIVRRRPALVGERKFTTLWSREAQILVAAVALVLLAVVTLAGTVSAAMSDFVWGRKVVVGPAFYNNVLVPVGLVLLSTVALAPLLRWGRRPNEAQMRTVRAAAFFACAIVVAAWIAGVRHPIALAVVGLGSLTAATLAGALLLDSRRIYPEKPWIGLFQALAARRRQYTGFVIHLGFVCLALGVMGSSLGSRRQEVVMKPGETIEWAGRSIHFSGLNQSEQADKFVAEAELSVSTNGSAPILLRPAQHLYKLQDLWTTEVAINSTWQGDFYTILHNGEAGDAVRLTLVENLLMRWIWFGGIVMGAGALAALWPARRLGGIEKPARAVPIVSGRSARQRALTRQVEAP